MAEIYLNPLCGSGLNTDLGGHIQYASIDAAAPIKTLQDCPAHSSTPLCSMVDLAHEVGVKSIYLKDERARMGLGSFKALGAAYVIASDAVDTGLDLSASPLAGKTYITASAGNHGLSVAAGARIFGAQAVIYLSNTVPDDFVKMLEAQNATVVRHGDNYEESMQAAIDASVENEGWVLLSDSSWPGYEDIPYRLMEGYLVMASEMVEQIPDIPTHLLLQAGVGGLAAAVAGYARHIWGADLQIIVVEPEAAPALIQSIKSEKIIDTTGPVSNMGRLDCKTPSMIALKTLAKTANIFMTISEQDAEDCVEKLNRLDMATTPSGAAGIAPIFLDQEIRQALGLNETSRIAAIISEKS